MKTTIKVLGLVTVFAAASQGAIVITGSLGPLFKAANGTTNIPSGALVMIVADTGNNGFLNLSAQGAVMPGLTGLTGTTLTKAQAGSFTAGSLFGGDTIVATTLSGASGSISSFLPATDISRYTGENFAVIWFETAPATVAANVAADITTSFGMIRLADWTLPADFGSFTLSPTDSNGPYSYYSTSAATTATQVGGGFFTGSGTAADSGSTAVRAATFTIGDVLESSGVGVPESSTALLGALGALGLLRRRRIR